MDKSALITAVTISHHESQLVTEDVLLVAAALARLEAGLFATRVGGQQRGERWVGDLKSCIMLRRVGMATTTLLPERRPAMASPDTLLTHAQKMKMVAMASKRA